jgi:uncharacterized protein (DUF1800 family)
VRAPDAVTVTRGTVAALTPARAAADPSSGDSSARDEAAVLHLLRRTTFGPTPGMAGAVASSGPAAWLESQLDPAAISDRACDAVLARLPGLDWPISVVRERVNAGQISISDPMSRVVQASVARAAWSRRQLLEVMVQEWSDHFCVPCPSPDVWDSRAHYDAAAIRPYALGRFADLLVAASTHPAMLRFLDAASATAAHPNENHGRELLELHTVGIDAGYGENDVLSSARILSGLSIDEGTGEFVYRPDRHWTGPVRVLGFSHPNAHAGDGYQVVLSYLGWLARHPATARRVARRLALRFVRDDPPDDLVADLAAAYLDADTAIVPVLRRLFSSAAFADSAGAKVRRPLEDLIGALRILGVGPDPAGVAGVEAMVWVLADAGQAPLGWPRPDGYPQPAAAWTSAGTLLNRWNAHLRMAGGWWPRGLRYPEPRSLLPGQIPATWAGVLDALARRLVFAPLSGAEVAAVCAAVGVHPDDSPSEVDRLLPPLAALILDSPHHTVC